MGAKKRKKAKQPKLVLESRRGKRMPEGGICAQCKNRRGLVWRYSKSNHGEVNICSECKPKVMDRSFGRIDAMAVAKLGGFETMRRRH